MRHYLLSIALGVLVVVALGMGSRLWQYHRAEQPILDPYKSFIEWLAAASPEARSELQSYLAASGRDSVASQDFLPLCAMMLRQAQAQDARLELNNMTLEQFHSVKTLCQKAVRALEDYERKKRR